MIGSNISTIRKKKGMTLSELAERANISKSYLSNMERSLNKNPSIHIIDKLASVLGVEVKELLEGPLEEKQPTIDREWCNFFNVLKDSGVQKEMIYEYKMLIEFIKWKNEQKEEKK